VLKTVPVVLAHHREPRTNAPLIGQDEKDSSMHDKPTGLRAALQSSKRKRCPACQQTKLRTGFFTASDGLSSYCQDCRRAAAMRLLIAAYPAMRPCRKVRFAGFSHSLRPHCWRTFGPCRLRRQSDTALAATHGGGAP
jgi:hypothetical protein